MDIDTEAYPIDYITNYDKHLDCKPPEKTKENPKMKNEAYMRSLIKKNGNKVRSYRKHGDAVKEQLFFFSLRKSHDFWASNKAARGQ